MALLSMMSKFHFEHYDFVVVIKVMQIILLTEIQREL